MLYGNVYDVVLICMYKFGSVFEKQVDRVSAITRVRFFRVILYEEIYSMHMICVACVRLLNSSVYDEGHNSSDFCLYNTCATLYHIRLTKSITCLRCYNTFHDFFMTCV